MSLYTQFKTDTGLEKSGILLEYGNNSKGKPITIRVARAGGANKAFEKKADLKLKPFRRQIQQELISTATVEKLMREVYADAVVLGWENVEDENGNDLPFSYENCVKLFTDLPDLFRDVQEQSQRSVLFREEIREVDVKN